MAWVKGVYLHSSHTTDMSHKGIKKEQGMKKEPEVLHFKRKTTERAQVKKQVKK
jgi:hypothetical protein